METEFVFETEYGQKEMTVMARTLRKTLRRGRNRRSRIVGWIVIIMALLPVLPLGGKNFVLDYKVIVNCLVVVTVFAAFALEDSFNGFIAKKRMLKGMEKIKTTFREDGYYSETEVGRTEWEYDKVELVAETAGYFVFIFGQNHAQVYDKNSLSGGTAAEFKQFIQVRTDKQIISVQ